VERWDANPPHARGRAHDLATLGDQQATGMVRPMSHLARSSRPMVSPLLSLVAVAAWFGVAMAHAPFDRACARTLASRVPVRRSEFAPDVHRRLPEE